MPGIFVSYRRKDSAGHAGRVFDRLRDHFGAARVFRDVNYLKGGEDFVEALARAVDSSEVFIVVIGREWFDARDDQGRLRLDDPRDFIRLEVETALRRKVLVLPVMVEGATMPDMDDLPEPLRPLARRQAIELSDHRWDFDMQELISRIEEVIGRPGQRWKRVAIWTAAAAMLLAGVAISSVWWPQWRNANSPLPKLENLSASASPSPANPSPTVPKDVGTTGITEKPVTPSTPDAARKDNASVAASTAGPTTSKMGDSPRSAGQAKPEETKAAETKAAETKAAEARVAEAKAAEAKAAEARVAEAKAAEAKAAEARIAEAKAAEAKAAEARVAEAKTAEAKAAEARAAEAKAAEAKAAEARAAEAKAAEARAAEARAAEAKAAEAKAAEAKARAAVQIPDFSGESIRSVGPRIQELGLRMKTELNSTARFTPGTVYAQRPPAGSMVERGGVIQLFAATSLQSNEHAAGSAYLRPNRLIDLDGGSEVRGGWDVTLVRTDAGPALSFGGSARGALLASAARGRFDATSCDRVAPSASTLPISDGLPNQTVCVRTTDGRTAAIALGRYEPDPPELFIRYSTLAAPAAGTRPPVLDPRPPVIEPRPPVNEPRPPRDQRPPSTAACAQALQGRIAWDYSGSTRWNPDNVERLCRGASDDQPARCFNRVMHGGINWGGGTRWEWANAIDLCEGTTNADATVACFQRYLGAGRPWGAAIAACDERRPSR